MYSDFKYHGHRNSYTVLNEPYFWTITVKDWHHLLKERYNKMIIIESLQWLLLKNLVEIYGYVIMPNHLHLLWTQLKKNGKEFLKNSFEKFTAHRLMEIMKQSRNSTSSNFEVNASDRKHNIWQRDPLAIKVFSRKMAVQKLEYMHNNPLQQHWALAMNPVDYGFSSARFYETGYDKFNLVTHYLDAFQYSS